MNLSLYHGRSKSETIRTSKNYCFISIGAIHNFLITLQGFPPAITFAGILLTTRLFAPITVFSPMLTPFKTTVFMPNQTLSFITTGALLTPLLLCLSFGSMGCQSKSVIKTFAPDNTLLPIVIEFDAPITVPLNPILI